MRIIRLKQKIFRRDEFTLEYHLPVSDEIKNNFTEGEISNPYFNIEATNKYSQDTKTLSEAEKKILAKLKKDIKDGFLYEDGPNGGDTHFLRDYSKKEKHVTFSKKITDTLRFNYTIYPLSIKSITDSKTKKKIHYLSQKIVYQSCGNHTMNGVGRYIK